MSEAFYLRRADWQTDFAALRQVRETVFVREQHVPRELEWDDLDAASEHVLALDANAAPVGTGRLTPDGHVGRMAVLKPWRGSGVGTAVLRRLMALALDRGAAEVILNAQVTAIPFYERQGFTAEGEPFLDAGIEHRSMRARLTSDA